MHIEDLQTSLEGATDANLKQIAKDYFTPQFLQEYAGALLNNVSRVNMLGIPVEYNPSELDKCVIHYCTRELIGDLWNFSIPTLRRHMTGEGRFNLDEAVASSTLTPDIQPNLDIGKRFILETTDQLCKGWVRDLYQRHQIDDKDQTAIKFAIYRAHSTLIGGGDWDHPSVLFTTFTSAAREAFDWVRDYPNLSRAEVEEITGNSTEGFIQQADQLGIKSHAKEVVIREVTDRGELAYILDPEHRKIIFNPLFLEDVARVEEAERENYHDQTQLLLRCPAKYVSSSLYKGGSMLHDLIRFRSNVYTELYLATHQRR